MDVVLEYTGVGEGLGGVPARDLTPDDMKKFGLDKEQLLATGLYKVPGKKKASEPKGEVTNG